MGENKTIDNDTNDEHNVDTNKDSTAKMKSKLKKEVEELKSTILQIQCSLDILKFGNIKTLPSTETFTTPSTVKVSDVDVRLQNELYRYAGFYCAKVEENQYIFKFSSSNKHQTENIFAVQILHKNNKPSVGKWVMPMSIDMDDLLRQCPLDKMSDISGFVRNCKQHVDCYFARLEQCQELMKTVSTLRNCKLHFNLGYTEIILELMGVHIQKDVYIDLIIYLIYNADEARPHKIALESNRKILSEKAKSKLLSFLVFFQTADLSSSFERISTERNDMFAWSIEEGDDTLIELNDSSSSEEEGYLESLTLQTHKLAMPQRRKQRIQKKHTKRKQVKMGDGHEASNNNAQTSTSKGLDSALAKQVPSAKKNENDITITPNRNTYKDVKLKQTKLRFQIDQEKLSNKNHTPSPGASSTTNLTHKKRYNPLTSTPLRPSMQGNTKFTSSDNIDISDIEKEEILYRNETHKTDTNVKEKIQPNDKNPIIKESITVVKPEIKRIRSLKRNQK